MARVLEEVCPGVKRWLGEHPEWKPEEDELDASYRPVASVLHHAPNAVVFQQSSQPAGRVLKQSPAPGATARPNSRVRLAISTGPNPQPSASVPNVVGQDQAAAATALRDAGFRVLVLNRPTTKLSQDGKVIAQAPRTGNIPGGSLVAIYVGRSG